MWTAQIKSFIKSKKETKISADSQITQLQAKIADLESEILSLQARNGTLADKLENARAKGAKEARVAIKEVAKDQANTESDVNKEEVEMLQREIRARDKYIEELGGDARSFQQIVAEIASAEKREQEQKKAEEKKKDILGVLLPPPVNLPPIEVTGDISEPKGVSLASLVVAPPPPPIVNLPDGAVGLLSLFLMRRHFHRRQALLRRCPLLSVCRPQLVSLRLP